MALAKRLSELAEGRHVARTVETVESYCTHWIENIAPASRAEITIERYESLLRAHIIPGLGSVELQKLTGVAIDRFYATRRQMGLAPLNAPSHPFTAWTNPRVCRQGKEARPLTQVRCSDEA
ncbi:MAG: hypothetical protein ACM3MH_08920 [Actinomycetota bacterium]